jgi:hypothetical protein
LVLVSWAQKPAPGPPVLTPGDLCARRRKLIPAPDPQLKPQHAWPWS